MKKKNKLKDCKSITNSLIYRAARKNLRIYCMAMTYPKLLMDHVKTNVLRRKNFHVDILDNMAGQCLQVFHL
jgi:gamma-glutamylcyclotransferase (GGCT)/AIG2-like uncharacterized protein YtfP